MAPSHYVDIHPHIISSEDHRYPRSPLFGVQSEWSRERPITVDMGTYTIAGTDTTRIITAANGALDNPHNKSTLRIPPLWDGRTADRILDALVGKI